MEMIFLPVCFSDFSEFGEDCYKHSVKSRIFNCFSTVLLRFLFTTVSLFFIISGCSTSPRYKRPRIGIQHKHFGTTSHSKPSIHTQTGMASFYAKNFHGKKTASGEIYYKHKFTAAHRNLPFNTLVKVTNLENNRSVIVRINDRGPFVKKRIIDLSEAAAKKIGMIHKGVAKVRIDVINDY